jgi:hypothetical protein
MASAKDIELTDLQFHPLANCWPLMEDEDFDDLVESIRLTGLRNAILLDSEGLIIDGRNRYRACLIAGKKPRYEYWDGKGSLMNIIKAYNKDRRHMTASQTAASVALMDEVIEKEKADAADRRKRKPDSVKEPVPEQTSGQSRDKLGEQFGVSGRYVSDAIKVKNDAPEVFEKVHKGEVSLKAATKAVKEAADLPTKEERAEAANAIVERNQQDKPRQAVLSDVEQLIEGIERLINKTDAMAAKRMGHNDKSKALVAHFKEAIKLAKAMGRSWRNE